MAAVTRIYTDTYIPMYGRDRETWADFGLPRILDALNISPDAPREILAESLPFSLNDTTAGAENELQTLVTGSAETADFPLYIRDSNYYQNLLKRASVGENSRRPLLDLREFLDSNTEQVWENSWVRFPESLLSAYARQVMDQDLRADKSRPDSPGRSDSEKYFFTAYGKKHIRIPVSYLLKLSLADLIRPDSGIHPALRAVGEKLTGHFLNDNTSPETFSFCPVSLNRKNGMGKGIARESLKRYLLTQLLAMYANRKFGLAENGQKVVICFAPHPHVRQKKLSTLISDSFYRELFMSPCLSGWNRGEDKHRYMHLCHQVLSRSQLHSVSKLKEAGIISRNLVVLPSLSNVSLANNGTHISLGSRRLTQVLKDPNSGFDATDEKYTGDLLIKIMEHFLPLFAGTYSADPFRLDFSDFHPEKALGFLPHELDFTHLRMIWRRWKKKANLKIFGQPVTPFGPPWLDKWFARIFGLKGDFVHDFRLIDYFVSLMSTDRSAALDGRMGNDRALKQDLADFGLFDPAMPMYLLYRMRAFSQMGFSGFEGRYYSLFENLTQDMGHAASLQNLLTALAYQYILSGQITHEHIPDTPHTESERRQIFFGAAIGIPTFFVHKDTRNLFLRRILAKTQKTRLSHRYKGYIRVYNTEYRKALIAVIREDAADLIAMMGMEETLKDLHLRVTDFRETSASASLTKRILEHANAKNPMNLPAEEFNRAAEGFYRTELRESHIREALAFLEQDFRMLDGYAALRRDVYSDVISSILENQGALDFFERVRKEILSENISSENLEKFICLLLLSVYADIKKEEGNE
ncbi:MAG: hypothetical protein AB7S75_21920 [Desulfococcaceae bacterium]